MLIDKYTKSRGVIKLEEIESDLCEYSSIKHPLKSLIEEVANSSNHDAKDTMHFWFNENGVTGEDVEEFLFMKTYPWLFSK